MAKLFTFQKNLYAPPRERAPLLPLEELARALTEYTDEQWGQYAFRRDPIGGKFTPEEKDRLIRLSLECGDDYAGRCRREMGPIAPSLAARKLGVEVRYPHRPGLGALEGNRVLFAQYTAPGVIEVFTDCTDKAERAFADPALRGVLGDVNVREVLLAHELFHFFEERDAGSIFTEQEKKDLSVWGVFHNRSRIHCLGEMAAMRFAKGMLGLGYSPYVFDVLLSYLYDRQAACNLFAGIQKLMV